MASRLSQSPKAIGRGGKQENARGCRQGSCQLGSRRGEPARKSLLRKRAGMDGADPLLTQRAGMGVLCNLGSPQTELDRLDAGATELGVVVELVEPLRCAVAEAGEVGFPGQFDIADRTVSLF